MGVIARVATCIRGPGTSPLAIAVFAFRLQVANGGESMRKCNLCIARGKDRAIRNRFLQQLRIVFLGGDVALQENVRVGINETG